MTTAINLGPAQITNLASATRKGSQTGSGADFAALLGLAPGGPGAQKPQSSAAPLAPDQTGAQGGQPRSLIDLLSALMGALGAITKSRNDDLGLDQDMQDGLTGLIETLQAAMDDDISLEPDSPLLAELAQLAKSLGIELDDEPAAALDALASLASSVASHLREEAPELAGRLNDLAKGIDALAARVENLASNAPPDADMRRRLAESENKLNPDTAIKGEDADEAKSGARQGEKAEADKPPRPLPAFQARQQPEPNAQAARDRTQPAHNSNAGGTQAAPTGMGAEVAKTAELPEGLSFTPNQGAQVNSALAAAKPAASAAYMRPEAQLNMPHVAVEIARHVQNGVNRFEIRLNPPELGRIDVRLEMDQSGNVMARLAVERSETLDLLQRDQRALEKALADAGLDADKTDLEFSLKQDDDADGSEQNEPWRSTGAERDTAETENQPAPGQLYRGYARLDAVNLWV